ncbi:sesquipedalian-1 [Narcine bancroftii]|uniref:sesquipedalian-1 n=1 Tax=Narcine bancroftii TaxID=1343680 RepID=UPI0038311E12
MKLNERSVAYYATCDSPTDKTGYLHKKGERNTAYHRRWFVLKGNLFFYFEEKESKEPIGVIILEGCTVELCESSEEHAFAIKFENVKSRTYKMAAESPAEMEAWVKALSRASFDYMRIVVRELEKQLEEMQQNKVSGRKSQRKQLVRKHAIDPSSAPQVSNSCTVSYGIPVKENGYVPWNTTVDQMCETELNGKAHTVNDNNDIAKHFPEQVLERPPHTQRLPPPLPPRRRSATGGVTSGIGGLMLSHDNAAASTGTYSFSRLHEWYGRDVIQLQRQWQEHKIRNDGESQTDHII